MSFSERSPKDGRILALHYSADLPGYKLALPIAMDLALGALA
jgi:hypothetical protein